MSQCFADMCGDILRITEERISEHSWTDGICKAKALAKKIQDKGVINLEFWQEYKTKDI